MGKRKQKPVLSAVIPVYNSKDILTTLHERLTASLEKLDKNYEIIYVNDCSPDTSWDTLQEIATKDSKVIAVNLMNNFGQHNATMCGFKQASGDYIVTLDDDCQHPPEEIEKLYQTITTGEYSMVYGQYLKKKHGWFRDLASFVVNKLIAKITGTGFTVTSFRIIKKQVVDEIVKFDMHNVMVDLLIKTALHTKNIGHCVIRHDKRVHGKSNYTFIKLILFAMNMVFTYTIWPLRIATILGFFSFFFSLVLAIVYLLMYVFGDIQVAGWTTIILLITMFSGLILLILGIYGEYIGKLQLNVNKEPQYIIKEIMKRG